MKKFLALITLVLTITSSPVAQTWTTELDSILSLLSEQGIFNGQVLLAEKDDIVFSKAYGVHNNKPITTTFPLPIASVSKPMSTRRP
jgi:CubicO group peptidase (beta-lactamase class C family)